MNFRQTKHPPLVCISSSARNDQVDNRFITDTPALGEEPQSGIITWQPEFPDERKLVTFGNIHERLTSKSEFDLERVYLRSFTDHHVTSSIDR